MPRGTQRLFWNRALPLTRLQVRRFKPWCERLGLLVALMAIYIRLRAEIGNWQALLAATGTPLTVLKGTWSFRLIAGQARRQFPHLFGGQSPQAAQADQEPASWLSPTPSGHDLLPVDLTERPSHGMPPPSSAGGTPLVVVAIVRITEVTTLEREDPGS